MICTSVSTQLKYSSNECEYYDMYKLSTQLKYSSNECEYYDKYKCEYPTKVLK